MARPVLDKNALNKAKEVWAEAKTVEIIRQTQAVILPLEHGLTMECGLLKCHPLLARDLQMLSKSIQPVEDRQKASLKAIGHDTSRVHSIVAWPWIMNAMSK